MRRRLDQCSSHAQFVSSISKLHALATADAAMARSFLQYCMKVRFMCVYVCACMYMYMCMFVYVYSTA